MNAFSISPPVVERLGWVLVHSLWQFALIVLLASVTVRLLRRNSAALRYGVLGVAMIATVVVPIATWWFQHVAVAENPVHHAELDFGYERASMSNVPVADLSFDDQPLLVMDETDSSPAIEVAATDVPPPETLPAILPPVQPEIEIAWSERVAFLLRPWLAWIVAGWGLGVGLCSLRPLLGWYTLKRLRRVGVSPLSDGISATSNRVAERLGLRKAVRVLNSTLATVPIVVGYFRPVILLPVSLVTNIPGIQLEAILAHELAHVRRHDFLVNMVQTLVETVFFYHPAVWWLSSRLRAERENCCDDMVVSALGNRVEYGRALLAIEELRGRSAVLAVGASDGSLLARVRRILGLQADATNSSAWPTVSLLVCGIVSVFALSILSRHNLANAGPEETEPKASVEPLSTESTAEELTADELADDADTLTPDADSDAWPPQDSAEFIKRLYERDAEFSNRSMQVERRWVEHVDPSSLRASERQERRTQGDPKLDLPSDNEIPESYDQLHRVRFLMTARYDGLAFDNTADLETMKHAGYAGPVEAKRWPSLGPIAWNRVMLEQRVWQEQDLNLKRKSFEWTCGYGFASVIESIDSMQVENERLVIKGRLRGFLHFWSTQEDRDRIGPPNDRFEMELDRDLVVRRAVFEIAGEPARQTRSALLEATFHKRSGKDIERYKRFLVETSGTVRPPNAPPVAVEGTYQVILQDAGNKERVLLDEKSELLEITDKLTEQELKNCLSPDRQVTISSAEPDEQRDANSPTDVAQNAAATSPPAPSSTLNVKYDMPGADQATAANELEFLKAYPKLDGLSLNMTEPQFLQIVRQQALKTRKTVEDEKVTHYIELGDGHTLIIMFSRDGKCSGIQRVGVEDSGSAHSEATPGIEKSLRDAAAFVDLPSGRMPPLDKAVELEVFALRLRAIAPKDWIVQRKDRAFRLRGPEVPAGQVQAQILLWFEDVSISSSELSKRDKSLPEIGVLNSTRIGRLYMNRNEQARQQWPEFGYEIRMIDPVDQIAIATTDVLESEVISQAWFDAALVCYVEIRPDGRRKDQLVRLDGSPIGITSATKFLVVGEVPDPTQATTEAEKETAIRHRETLNELKTEAERNGVKIISLAEFEAYTQSVLKAGRGSDTRWIKDANQLQVPDCLVTGRGLVEVKLAGSNSERPGLSQLRTLREPAFHLPGHSNIECIGYDNNDKELVVVSTCHLATVRRWDLVGKKLISDITLSSDKHLRGNFRKTWYQARRNRSPLA